MLTDCNTTYVDLFTKVFIYLFILGCDILCLIKPH